jgi:hypothetical protein
MKLTDIKNLKTTRLFVLSIVLVLGLQLQASAQGILYNITFTDGGSNVGSGQVDVDGGYAINGYFDVTAGAGAGHYVLYTVDGTGTYQNPVNSPYTQFYYDNAVYLGANPEYPNNNPFVDMYGLLFADSNDHSHNNEVSIWAGADDGTYTYNGVLNGNAIVPVGIIGNATISLAPEPSTLTLIILALVLTFVFVKSGRRAKLFI